MNLGDLLVFSQEYAETSQTGEDWQKMQKKSD